MANNIKKQNSNKLRWHQAQNKFLALKIDRMEKQLGEKNSRLTD